MMGGIPVLAHPVEYLELTNALLSLLIPLGLKGVEVFTDRFKTAGLLTQMLAFIKNQYPDLKVTIGSDCHGCSVDGKTNYTPGNVMGLGTDFGLSIENYYGDIYMVIGTGSSKSEPPS